MTTKQTYTIGVDAGGTYTDAVLVEEASGRVIVSAKRPTTHYDLSQGIRHVLSAIMEESAVSPQDVTVTSVSTTLATNALVENKGAEVALFVVGYNQRLEVPAVAARYIPGGHTIKGDEVEQLGVEFVIEGINELRDAVDAWAVCGSMAFVNPTHELVVAKAVSLSSDKPVFCSHEASMKAGMKERATTACMNAQLLPVMQEFLAGVQQALQELGVGGKVLVVRGDAKAMQIDEALRHASSTVASGPAATALYGASESSASDALILDVGGTTTDITLVRAGKPVVDSSGMKIGKWETHVEAVEMYTVGIGGDSLVQPMRDGSYSFGPSRVVPLCMAADVPSPQEWLGERVHARCILCTPSAKALDDISGIEGEAVLRHLLTNGAATPGQLAEQCGLAEITVDAMLAKLTRRQLVVDAGFTPTDALHVLGKLAIGNADVAMEGAAVLGARIGLSAEAFAGYVLEQIEILLEETVLEHVTGREVGRALPAFLAKRNEHALVSIDVSLNVPMVGIGAAAKCLLPGVAKRLNTSIVFPERHEVGNALGAVLMAHAAAK